LSKVFESIIKDYLADHLEDNLVIPSFQFGFQPNLSTTIQLTQVIETIRTNFNKKTLTGLLLLDVEQAFDKVLHDALILKLIKINTSLYLTKIIQSYLSFRQFRVKINNSLSKPVAAAAGVPQGSVLGPTLFNTFLHDIPKTVDRRLSLVQYADDIAIIASSKDPAIIANLLKRQLTVIDEYLNKWGMRLNIAKSQPIIFRHTILTQRRRDRIPREIRHKGQIIPLQNSVKYLGITLDTRLSFHKNIQNSRQKALARINQLYPLLSSKNIKTKTAITIYKSYIRPIMTYASPAWINTPITYRNKLQIIQNNVLRIITKSPPYTPIKELHDITGIETLQSHIQRLNRNFLLKIQKLNNPIIASSLIPIFPPDAKYPTPLTSLRNLTS
jgi:hypothetical protein